MTQQSREHIIDECAYAVACCLDHYCDEGLSGEGVAAVKRALAATLPQCISSGIAFREYNGLYREFSDRIVWPPDWYVTERQA